MVNLNMSGYCGNNFSVHGQGFIVFSFLPIHLLTVNMLVIWQNILDDYCSFLLKTSVSHIYYLM